MADIQTSEQSTQNDSENVALTIITLLCFLSDSLETELTSAADDLKKLTALGKFLLCCFFIFSVVAFKALLCFCLYAGHLFCSCNTLWLCVVLVPVFMFVIQSN